VGFWGMTWLPSNRQVLDAGKFHINAMTAGLWNLDWLLRFVSFKKLFSLSLGRSQVSVLAQKCDWIDRGVFSVSLQTNGIFCWNSSHWTLALTTYIGLQCRLENFTIILVCPSSIWKWSLGWSWSIRRTLSWDQKGTFGHPLDYTFDL